MADANLPDPNLHLAVLSALLDKEVIDEDSLTELLDGIVSKESEPLEKEGDLIRQAIARLHTMPLPQGSAATIEKLDFDGGNAIYMLIEGALDVDTGGEADYYQLGSLAGIGALTSLKTLDLDCHGFREAELDLEPLKKHPALSSIVLSGECVSARALETLPRLAKLNVSLAGVDDEDVLDRLAKRGVSVKR